MWWLEHNLSARKLTSVYNKINSSTCLLALLFSNVSNVRIHIGSLSVHLMFMSSKRYSSLSVLQSSNISYTFIGNNYIVCFTLLYINVDMQQTSCKDSSSGDKAVWCQTLVKTKYVKQNHLAQRPTGGLCVIWQILPIEILRKCWHRQINIER